MRSIDLRRVRSSALLLSTALAAACASTAAHAQIFVANVGNKTIGEYNFDGTPINTHWLQLTDQPLGLTFADGFLYESNQNENTVGKYTLDGTLVGLTSVILPRDIAVSGNTLYAINAYSSRTLSSYNLTTGAVIKSSLITGIPDSTTVTVSDDGSRLFVSRFGAVGEYDAATGAPINSNFITLSNGGLASAMFRSGSDLYTADFENIGHYTTAGEVIDPALAKFNRSSPWGLVVYDSTVLVGDGSAVEKFTTAGERVSYSFLPGVSNPHDLIIVPHLTRLPCY